MARDWQDLFVTNAEPVAADEAEPAREEERRGFFRRLRENMSKTRQAISAEVSSTLFDELDAETWEHLEEAARAAGHRRVVLDTSSGQPEALAMYRALGYREVPDYNANPYAAHWFAKAL